MELILFLLFFIQRLKFKRTLSKRKKSIKQTKNTPFHARSGNEPLHGRLHFSTPKARKRPSISTQKKIKHCHAKKTVTTKRNCVKEKMIKNRNTGHVGAGTPRSCSNEVAHVVFVVSYAEHARR